jgi:cytochrome c oxidase assembly protein subunit 15
MKALALISLLLVIVLVSLSAYLRLANSGIGCPEWPQCYGRIGAAPAAALPATLPASPGDAYRKLVDESGKSLAWATPLHRLVASVLGLFIVFVFAASLQLKHHRLLCAALLGLTVWLAILGIRSGSLHDPAVVMGNLAGGFCMLGMLGWLVFSGGPRGNPPLKVAVITGLAATLLCLQILLGGYTSANFAATSCQTLPDCHGGWWPGPALARALDLSREHEVTPSGQALGGQERIAIHRAHRLGAMAVFAVAVLAALLAFGANARFRPVAAIIIVLATAEVLLGVAAILTGIPIILAVSHNWLAALLLLALLKLLALSTPSANTSAHTANRLETRQAT